MSLLGGGKGVELLEFSMATAIADGVAGDQFAARRWPIECGHSPRI